MQDKLQNELADYEGSVDAQQCDALPAGQLLGQHSGEDHQGHDTQHHGNLEDQGHVQAGVQQEVLAGNLEGSQRNSHAGNQNQAMGLLFSSNSGSPLLSILTL